MFDNNNAGMYGIPQGTGYNYNGMQPNQMGAKIPNTLTNEEIAKLMQKENQFTLQVTETEKLRAICTHRTQDGMGDTIVEDQAGECRCYICNYAFRPLAPDTSIEVLEESIANVIDILQTIKLLYINMPPEAAREYFMIIPLIEKIPKLFEYACKDYAKHANFNSYSYNNRNMSTMNLFNMVMGGGFNNMGMPQYNPQQQMGNVYPQAGMMGNPAMNPAAYNMQGGYPQSNGFGFVGNGDPNANMQMGGYQPATNNYQYNPTQQAAQATQVAPVTAPAIPGATAPAETTATTDGKDVNVTSTFKA